MQYGPQSAFDGARVLGAMLLAGCAMGVFYDVFRIIRRFFRCSYATVFMQDIFFFTVSAVCVFFAATTLSGGRMRISFAAAALAGWLLYSISLGSAFMFIIDKALALLRAAALKIWGLIDRHIFKA